MIVEPQFGINDVLLPQDLLGGQSAIDRGVRLLHFDGSSGWRVWEALTERNARNYAWHPNLLFCSKENDRMEISAVRILDRICRRLVLPPRSSTLSCGAKNGLAAETEENFARRSEEHTSELQSHLNLVCRLLLEKKKKVVNI